MRTFGEPYYNSDNDTWNSDIVNIPDRDEDYHESYADDYEEMSSEMQEMLSNFAIPDFWVLRKFYSFLYDGKGIVKHPNRVHSQLLNMIKNVTWQDLLDMGVLTETDIFNNLDQLKKHYE